MAAIDISAFEHALWTVMQIAWAGALAGGIIWSLTRPFDSTLDLDEDGNPMPYRVPGDW